MNRLSTPARELDLTRYPDDPRDPLRAWDAADEYLLDHLAEHPPPGATVVLGDRWGALTTALAVARDTARAGGPAGAVPAPVAQISDSRLAQLATAANLERNGLPAGAVRALSTRDTPPDRIDTLVVRVPKSLALLEDQLHRLAPALRPGATVLGTGMAKEIHTSTLRLFEDLLGPTRTTLARRKARLILCAPDPDRVRPANPWPRRWTLPPDAAAQGTVVNHAGVFCAEHLDIGTRLLLDHLPALSGPRTVVDLGCGNGVVGLAVALADPLARVVFTDESYQAVASAEATFRANTPPGAAAEFRVGDSLAGIEPGSVDLVLNNPPFHSHQATTDTTARRMFADAHRALRPGGELWVVGNRHLGYHLRLRRLFGGCRLVASNAKFVVLRAVKR